MNVYNGFSVAGLPYAEKFDGICAEWDGEKLTKRDGGTITAPEWFTAGLPKTALRGELWCGRGKFEQVLSIYSSPTSGDRWQSVTFMVFSGGDRLSLGNHAKAVEWSVANSESEFDLVYKETVAAGGEGLVIRDASGVEFKRKPIDDDDAIVTGHAEGKGRNAGKCGALLVADRQGRKFRIGRGLPDITRESPPPIGTIVSFSFQGRTRTGKPRFASFEGVRAEQSLDFSSP